MSHLYIFPTMHHIPMKPHQSIFIMYQWQLIDPSSSMHSHQGQYILYYINHQSINPLTSINHLTLINDINQSNHWHQWQHDPTKLSKESFSKVVRELKKLGQCVFNLTVRVLDLEPFGESEEAGHGTSRAVELNSGKSFLCIYHRREFSDSSSST